MSISLVEDTWGKLMSTITGRRLTILNFLRSSVTANLSLLKYRYFDKSSFERMMFFKENSHK